MAIVPLSLRQRMCRPFGKLSIAFCRGHWGKGPQPKLIQVGVGRASCPESQLAIAIKHNVPDWPRSLCLQPLNPFQDNLCILEDGLE
jgi:hypothetical protein